MMQKSLFGCLLNGEIALGLACQYAIAVYLSLKNVSVIVGVHQASLVENHRLASGQIGQLVLTYCKTSACYRHIQAKAIRPARCYHRKGLEQFLCVPWLESVRHHLPCVHQACHGVAGIDHQPAGR